MKRYQNFINGEWTAPRSGKYYVRSNPADASDVLGEFPQSDKADVDAAVASAAEAFRTWGKTTPGQRAKYIEKFGKLVSARAQEIGEAVCREVGKTIKESLAEPARAASEVEFFVGEAERMEGITMPSDRPGVMSVACREPVGVVAAIGPWNMPFLTAIRKFIPALAFGNTVVFKPASDTPVNGIMAAQLMEEAGFPRGVFNMVLGRGSDMGDFLSSNPGIRAITYTGSVPVGRRINELAAPHFTRVQLEMGGKNPAVVAEAGDLDKVARELVPSVFGLSGQRCTAPSRIIVLGDEEEALVASLMKYMSQLVVGNGMTPGVTMGPIQSEKAGEKILAYIQSGLDEGAALKMGGHRMHGEVYDKGMFIEPTLFTGVTRSMRIAREEIFGPVLCVLRAKDFDEAMDIANDVEYGLSSMIFSDNLKYIHQFMENIQSGMVHVNHGSVTDAYMPFGGIKNSGLGQFSKGRTNRDFFTNFKVKYIKWE